MCRFTGEDSDNLVIIQAGIQIHNIHLILQVHSFWGEGEWSYYNQLATSQIFDNYLTTESQDAQK